MQFKRLLLVILLAVSNYAMACDICGCANMSSTLGTMPQFQRDFIGLRWNHSSFSSSAFTEYTTTDYFNQYELFGGYYVHKRVQLMGVIPYVDNKSSNDEEITTKGGIGDISLLVNYTAFNNLDSVKKITHKLIVGGGVNLPTGKYTPEEELNNNSPSNFQTGTGSVDYIFNTVYTVRHKKWGFITQGSYIINTINSSDYNFGNQLSVSGNLFYQIEKKGKIYLPSIGLQYEKLGRDINSRNYYQYGTGGTGVYLNAGFQVHLSKISMGIRYATPIEQNYAKGKVSASDRLSLNISYLF